MHVTTDRGLDLGCKASGMEPLLTSPEAESPASPAWVSATAPHSWLVSVFTPPAAVSLSSGVSQQLTSALSASFIQSQCPGAHNGPRPRVWLRPTLGSDSARLSLSTSLHALQTRPKRSCLSARPLTTPSAWNFLFSVSSLPPKILLSNYLEQRWANCATWALSLVLSGTTVFSL